jgi:hypothetical protein
MPALFGRRDEPELRSPSNSVINHGGSTRRPGDTSAVPSSIAVRTGAKYPMIPHRRAGRPGRQVPHADVQELAYGCDHDQTQRRSRAREAAGEREDAPLIVRRDRRLEEGVQERYRLTLAYIPLDGAEPGPPCRVLIRLRSAGHASCQRAPIRPIT